MKKKLCRLTWSAISIITIMIAAKTNPRAPLKNLLPPLTKLTTSSVNTSPSGRSEEKGRKEKDQKDLKDYQKLLLKEIFRSNVVHTSVAKAEKIFKSNKAKLSEVRKLLIKKKYSKKRYFACTHCKR